MDRLLDHGILLAQRTRLDGMRSGFRGRRIASDDIVTGMIILASIALVVWVLSYIVRAQEGRRRYRGPIWLFLSLCKAHRLRWSDRVLLWRVARAQSVRDPARLFLEPELLQPAKLGPSLRMRTAQLKRLSDLLFIEPPPPPPPAEPEAEPQETPEARHAEAPVPSVASIPAVDLPPVPASTGSEAAAFMTDLLNSSPGASPAEK